MSVANAHAFILTILCLIQFVCPCPPLSRLTTFPHHFSAPHACSSSPLADMIQHRLPLSGANLIPFYMSMTDARFKRRCLLLPQLWRIVDPHQLFRKRSRLWDLGKPNQDAIRDILDAIGDVLHDGANTSPLIDGGTFELKGHASFANPQVDENGFPACMLIDPDKISAMIAGKSNRKRFPHLFWGHRGYARMKLVTVGDGKSDIIESAHLFVLWAMFGPPGAHIVNPVCMHTCQRENCVQPLHLKHASNKENLQDRRRIF